MVLELLPHLQTSHEYSILRRNGAALPTACLSFSPSLSGQEPTCTNPSSRDPELSQIQEDLEEAQGCGGRKSWSAFWVPPVQGSLPGRRDLRHGFGPSTNHDQHLVLDRFHPLTPRWNLTFLVSRTGSHLHLTAVLEGHVKCSQPEVPDRSDFGLCRPSATVVWFLCSQVTLSVNAP